MNAMPLFTVRSTPNGRVLFTVSAVNAEQAIERAMARGLDRCHVEYASKRRAKADMLDTPGVRDGATGAFSTHGRAPYRTPAHTAFNALNVADKRATFAEAEAAARAEIMARLAK